MKKLLPLAATLVIAVTAALAVDSGNKKSDAPKPLALTTANFSEKTSEGVVLVDFWAAWCGPCKVIAPTIDELAEDYEGKAVIAKVDVDSNPELAQKFGIRSIPNLKILKDGEVVDEIVGVADKKAIAKALDKQLR